MGLPEVRAVLKDQERCGEPKGIVLFISEAVGEFLSWVILRKGVENGYVSWGILFFSLFLQICGFELGILKKVGQNWGSPFIRKRILVDFYMG